MDTDKEGNNSAVDDKTVTLSQNVVSSEFETVPPQKHFSERLSHRSSVGSSNLGHTDEMTTLSMEATASRFSHSSIASSVRGEGASATEEKKAARKGHMRTAPLIRFIIPDSESSLSNESESKKLDDTEEFIMEGELHKSFMDEQMTSDQITRDLLTDDDIESTDVEDGEDTRPPPKPDAILAKEVFLNTFEVPALSDISDEHSIEYDKSPHTSVTQNIADGKDKAKFRQPLTETSTSSTVTTPPSVSSGKIEPSSIEDESEGADENDELDFPSDKLDEFSELNYFSKPNEAEEDEELETFVKFQHCIANRLELMPENGEEDALLAKNKKERMEIILGFMNELFRNVVTEAELVSERDALRLKLDNFKLHGTLCTLKDDYLCERDLNYYLNARMCDYYKRVKNFRVVSKLQPLESQKEYDRYKEALIRLDYVTRKVMEAKKMNAYLMSSVLMDLTYVQTISLYTEEHLEVTMLKTLGSNKSENIRKFVERELRLIAQKRSEISDTRLYLITRTHTLGRITDRIRKLEQINDDICMDDFIAIQNQVVALDKKLEERNFELVKLRYNYHTELHLTQHNREKAYSLQNKILQKQEQLVKVQKNQHYLRERLYKAKLDRGRIRKQSSDLSFQGGLLSMPSLMYDYDETVEKVNKKHADVQELKETFKRLNQRISELESRCS